MTRPTWIDSFLATPEPRNVLCRDGLRGELSRADSSWSPLIERWRIEGFESDVFHTLAQRRFKSENRILPTNPLRALSLTSRESVRVVIVGDCPSPKGNIADGLAFSSLLPWQHSQHTAALIQEIQDDLGVLDRELTTLDHWAAQGVLLLNLVLTVEHENAKAHYGVGWEALTKAIIVDLINDEHPKAFLFWGKAPKDLAQEISTVSRNHIILTAGVPHTAASNRPGSFLGCGHFSKVNAFLASHGKSIEWSRQRQ